MAEETMRKPGYSVVKLQPTRRAIFNNLEEKVKSTKERAMFSEMGGNQEKVVPGLHAKNKL